MIVTAIALALLATGGGLTPAPAAATTPTVYYVAMGDSLGAGIGATTASNSYVQLVYQHELARVPGLQLRNFSCSGATTSSVLHSHSCDASVTQLEQAEAFLKAHPGQIAFLTIDIGANDIDGCAAGGSINLTCIASGIAAINSNLPQILSGLETASPGIEVFGTNYYDPFLAAWLTGPTGETQAQQSVTQADAFNAILTNLYAASGFPTADVATAFETDDFAPTGAYNSLTLPENVANICNWTHMCQFSDIHANDTGHALLAQTFEQLLDAPTTAGPPRSVIAAPGNGNATVRWTAPARDGGTPVTGFVVTPYIGTAAQTAQVFNTVSTSALVTGLTNGTTYTFRVAAKNAAGTGAKSAASAATTAGAPYGPTPASATPGSSLAVVRWTVPAVTNGSPVIGYKITAYHGTTLAKTVSVGITTLATVTGLANGTTYTFKVVARNANGASHPATTGATTIGAPRAPGGVTAAAGTAKAIVHWTVPSNNGAAITGYVVTPYIAGVAQPARTFNSTATTQSVGSLSATHTYKFKVAARNARGSGPQSLASNAITPT